MALSKQEIAAAQAMYRFTKRYERVFLNTRAKKAWRAAFFIFLFTSILLRHFGPDGSASIFPIVIFLSVFVCALTTVRYNRESSVLDILEREHRDELPWHRPPPLPLH